MPNQLINETSPYLLQHAHNPVDWHPWSEEALQKAVEEDKPILVSIGYAACHWCHVMEKESFEDEETAALMNRYFINIKIDREERPDLDNIYMDALQAMNGHGGWPLNIFLTPHKKPFYGGTYFPPRAYMNLPAWKDVLMGVAAAFNDKRNQIEAQADYLLNHLSKISQWNNTAENIPIQKDDIAAACTTLLKQKDEEWGGFGAAPKFPQTGSLRFLLHFSFLDMHSHLSADARNHALLSIDKMMQGGMYDHIGGGFARYATDNRWQIPHFEKMLYDNALLVELLTETYQLTNEQKYRKCIHEVISFIENELSHPQGGFYASVDADSEGTEGKFYTWKMEEVQKILGDDAAFFCDYFNVTSTGNWEGVNILYVTQPLSVIAQRHHYSLQEATQIIAEAKAKLFTERNKRIHPQTDDKIILSWNALMNKALAKAYEATGEKKYLTMSIHQMKFILNTFMDKSGGFRRVWKNDAARYPAFLDDYVFTAAALLQMHRVTADTAWLEKAYTITEKIIALFSDDENVLFFFTPKGQQDVILRKKEMYDGATPSANAVMAGVLLELSIFYNKPEWHHRSEKMIKKIADLAIRYPGSYSVWLLEMYRHVHSMVEVVLTGSYEKAQLVLQKDFLPFSIFMAAKEKNNDWPMLAGKEINNELAIYICQQYYCRKPAHTIEEAFRILKEAYHDNA